MYISCVADLQKGYYRNLGLIWTWGLLWTDFAKMFPDALLWTNMRSFPFVANIHRLAANAA